MRRLASLLLATFALSACVSSSDDDRYAPGVYGGGPVYRSYPGAGWGGYPYDRSRYGYRGYGDHRDDDDRDEERYTGAPWRDGESQQRFVKRSNDTVCDRRTNICYQDGHIDKTETEEYFGNRASREADAVRDRYKDRTVFVPRPNVACDDQRNVCLKGGRRDVRETRQVFGNDAAKQLNQKLRRSGEKKKSGGNARPW